MPACVQTCLKAGLFPTPNGRLAATMPTVLCLQPTVHSCLQEFNIEKLQLLEAEKAKIRKEYERRQGQVEVKKKM